MTKLILPIALLSLSAGLPSTFPNKDLIQKEPLKKVLSATEVHEQLLQNEELINILKKYNGTISGSTDALYSMKLQNVVEQLQSHQIKSLYPININEMDAKQYALRLAPVPDGFQSRMPVNVAPNVKEPTIIIDKQK